MALGDQLDPVAWTNARDVLYGKSGDKISERAAAAAAGVSIRELRAWVARSREKRVEDEPWVHLIAEEYDSAPLEQAGVLEDKLWGIAVNGVEEEVWHQGEHVGTKVKQMPSVAKDLMVARDPRYKPKPEVELNVTMDVDEMIRRLQATARMKLAAEDAKRPAIEGSLETNALAKVNADELFIED